MAKSRDCSGWATRFNIKCSDGRTILPGAFDEMDGETVPLVWDHNHKSPLNVLGHALLHARDEGVYADLFFNEDTTQGSNAKALVKNGDIKALSIYANQLKQNAGDVVHGVIREVSLVLAGANPGAFIDTAIAHNEYGEEPDEAVIAVWDEGSDVFDIAHSDDDDENEVVVDPEAEAEAEVESNDDSEEDAEDMQKDNPDIENTNEEVIEHADGDKGEYQKIYDSMNQDQKELVTYLVAKALEKGNSSDDNESKEEDTEVKHNVFNAESQGAYLAHNVFTKEQQLEIIQDMKKYGTLKESFLAHKEEMGIDDVLAHTDDHGIEYSTGDQTYMVNDPSFLFPEAKALNNPPEWIKRDTGWVSTVMGGTKHVPFARIKSVFADITADEARAKGFIKGNEKTEEFFTLLKRTTTPQTVYKKQKMDRDDIIDITDFDVVAWIRGEMRIMLDEEIARAILIGDGRNALSDDKISEDHIRPIYTDASLFTINRVCSFPANTSADEKAKAYIREAVLGRVDYKGSGNPVLFTTEEILTHMLLVENNLGERMYKSVGELATAMRVSKIVTVEVMENVTRTVDNETRNLVGIIVNLADYTVGADKGGAISMFDDFDIDRNQEKYLIETRCCGALTKPYSAIVIESVIES